jgi:hypothetical protein
MAQKLKSFEQFVSEMDRADEIEKDIVDMGSPEEHSEEEADQVQQANEAEAGVDAEDLDGKTKDVSGKIEFDDKEVNQDAQDDSAELNKDLKGEDEAGKEVNEDEEKEETEEAPEASEGEEPKTAIDLMKECMEAMKNEAKAWESDEHDEHTVETYMCEAAALLGNYAANSLKSLKEDYELEAYEAACNSIKEAFCKKVDEAKEANMAPSAQEPAAEEDPAAKA